VYNDYVSYVASALSLQEQAMFLANSIWETGGLQYMRELACSNGSCSYGNYYGRGMLQLTWQTNYQAASQSIYGDDTLVNNPDLAAEGDGVWRTALWFWNTNVHPNITSSVLDSRDLGVSVKIINGAIECPANTSAQNRLAIYNNILTVWGIGGTGSLAGC
jgi:predicted chitinase